MGPHRLTPLHLSTATALVARMAGASQDEEKQMLRQALIYKYINQLYEDAYQDWTNKHPMRVLGVARHAYALAQYRRDRLPPGSEHESPRLDLSRREAAGRDGLGVGDEIGLALIDEWRD